MHYFSGLNVSELHHIPCISKACGTSNGLINDTSVTENQEMTETVITCTDTGSYLDSPNMDPAMQLAASCLQRTGGKLPVWKIADLALTDSEEITCKDAALCVDPPRTRGNTLLVNDFDGETWEPGTTFSYNCPSNKTGSRIIQIHNYHVCIFSVAVHYNFTTPISPKREMLKNSKMLKLHVLDQMQMLKFRVVNFEFVRVHFIMNRKVETKDYPVVEISEDGVDFCRHLQNGVTYSKKVFKHAFSAGSSIDFFMVIEERQVIVGIFENFLFKTIGFYYYDELNTLPYMGFSSTNGAEWILEKGN